MNPWAWLGLLALVLPVFIHLLTRTPASVQRFPTLRFITVSRLPPRARRRIRDIVLLAVRMGILAAAVTALVQPVFVTQEIGARASNVVRAIVLDTSESMHGPAYGQGASSGGATMLDSATEVANRLLGEAETAIVVKTSNPGREIAGAVKWLATQPGVSEIAVISDFQKGSIDSVSLARVPAGVGVRLFRIAGVELDSAFTVDAAQREAKVAIAASASHTFIRWVRIGQEPNAGNAPEPNAPSISSAVSIDSGTAPVSVVRDGKALSVHFLQAGDGESKALMRRITMPSAQWMADVLLSIHHDGILTELANSRGAFESQVSPLSGATAVKAGSDSAPVVVLTDVNGTPVVTAGERNSALIIFMSTSQGSASALALTRAAARALSQFPQLDEHETVTIDAERVAAWERRGVSPGKSATDLRTLGGLDASDSSGRWLWLLAISLLLVEWFVRRSPQPDDERAMLAT